MKKISKRTQRQIDDVPSAVFRHLRDMERARQSALHDIAFFRFNTAPGEELLGFDPLDVATIVCLWRQPAPLSLNDVYRMIQFYGADGRAAQSERMESLEERGIVMRTASPGRKRGMRTGWTLTPRYVGLMLKAMSARGVR